MFLLTLTIENVIGAVIAIIIGALSIANGLSKSPLGRGLLQSKPIPIWFARGVHVPVGIALICWVIYWAFVHAF